MPKTYAITKNTVKKEVKNKDKAVDKRLRAARLRGEGLRAYPTLSNNVILKPSDVK
jgi:hypothetical protein